MRLFRFDKTLKLIFALLCAVGFSTTAFADGNWGAGDSNGPGCGKNDSVHCAGPKYRCFKYYGYTKSYALNTDDNQTDKKWTKLFGKYCLPKVSIWCNNNTKEDGTVCKSGDTDAECNMKEWKWNLDLKDDTVAETERSKNNCKFLACEPNVIGEEKFWWGGSSNAHHIFYQVDNPPNDNPIDVYFYCANEINDFDTVAKCVDKDEGKVVGATNCDRDTTGKRYYYKPNCDSKEDCAKKMNDWINNDKLKMCYNPWKQTADSNVVVFEDNMGGQTVGFSQFKYKDNNSRVGPCRYTPYYRTQFDLIDDSSKETKGDLLIMDKDDNRDADSLVHTKVSGEDYYFKIKEVGGDEDVDSSLKSLNCKITDKDGTEVVPESAAKPISGGIVSRVIAFFSGSGKRSQFQFPADAPYKPAASGDYTITCNGYGDDATTSIATASANFFVAPHSYVYSNVSMVFDSKSGLIPQGDTSGKATVNLISSQKGIEVKHESTGKATQKQSVQLAWDKKPVVKIGESLSINLIAVEAHTKDGSVDKGVDWDTNSIGKIVAQIPTAQTLAITNADNPQTAGATTNAKCTLGQDNPNPIQSAQGGMTMKEGVSDKTAPIGTISTLEAQVARATIDILDEELYAKIFAEQEGTNAEGKKKCNVDGFDCPFPQALRLENVDYEIAPKDFKIEVVDEHNNPIKVLYFGQGTSPKVEAGSKVRVTALKIDGATANNKTNLDATDIATTFTYGCAAQNMQFASDGSVTGSSSGGTSTQTSGVYFEIIGRDGGGFTVQAKDFSDGVAGSSDAIIKVQKDKDTPFTPAMKSEPVIIDNANSIIPMQMQYAKFPPDVSYYPKYEPSLSQDGSLVVLRGRINSIDTDNGSGSGAGGSITPTKVWYEFQCEYCNLDAVAKITGWDKNGGYTNADRSPTQQGWWIDRTFGTNNGNYITTSKIEIESGGLSIGSVSPNNGVDTTGKNTIGSQSISYGSKRQGTHKLNIRHGNESTDSTFNGATTMPYFLLYNAYWTGYADVKRDNNNKEVLDSSGNTIPTSTLISPKKWNTSSFVYVKEASKDDPRNYGVDTGGAKNTRSGGRTGKF